MTTLSSGMIVMDDAERAQMLERFNRLSEEKARRRNRRKSIVRVLLVPVRLLIRVVIFAARLFGFIMIIPSAICIPWLVSAIRECGEAVAITDTDLPDAFFIVALPIMLFVGSVLLKRLVWNRLYARTKRQKD